MTNCMVISLYLWQQQVAVRCQELPPLCLPQQLLPE